MKKQFKIVGAILLGLLVVTSGNLFASQGYGKQKVAYHINYDNPQAQYGALKNIQNHINAVGAKNLEVQTILHGKGLSLLLKHTSVKKTKLKVGNATKKMQKVVSKLKEQGVEFKVCANTLKGKKIDYKVDLYDITEEDIVPSGVAELAKLQAQGFAYIKP